MTAAKELLVQCRGVRLTLTEWREREGEREREVQRTEVGDKGKERQRKR